MLVSRTQGDQEEDGAAGGGGAPASATAAWAPPSLDLGAGQCEASGVCDNVVARLIVQGSSNGHNVLACCYYCCNCCVTLCVLCLRAGKMAVLAELLDAVMASGNERMVIVATSVMALDAIDAMVIAPRR